MSLISLYNINKSFGDQSVLKDVNLEVKHGERIGLVGMNGAGKTTLANIICGKTKTDSGEITRYVRNLKIGYLLQSTSYSQESFNHMFEQDHHDFLEVSSHLGLKKVQNWNSDKISGLSGGEKTKLAIAHVYTSKPDLLILDEPTNHLDFQGVEWLISELNHFEASTIIISHDRYFLDQTVDRIIEIEDGMITNYSGNYTFYREEKERRFESQKHQYEQQKKYEKKIELEIERLNNWSSKAHREAGKVGKMADMRMGVKEFYRTKAKKMDKQVKSRIKRLEKIEIEGVQKPKEESKVYFDLEKQNQRGRRYIVANQIKKMMGEKLLFQDSSFSILRGERIGLIGPNGCGKTTFLQILSKKDKLDDGDLWISPSLKISHLTQDVNDLNPDKTMKEIIEGIHYIRNDVQKTVNLLISMGLQESMLNKSMGQLSLGERTKFKLAQLMNENRDLLILDEPTNHLDLQSRERLEKTLEAYSGTLLIVSHDRYFLEKICDKLLIFKDDKVQKVESGYKEYSEKVQEVEKQPDSKTQENILEEKMVIENRLLNIIGELGRLNPSDLEYQALDEEYNKLTKRKKLLFE
ncbi:ABC-F family ATP-binding cassette domain-containing protein [Chengkuizengella axinellae]|uniref:ABC-F type ribosomal protection protein n=1 Tax=Chengkuizengella axinellae TaxID=3064388 RepID=A0ABT9J599_9BACL|nr:ABC-F type ribosomal protection protein [Chengkuizengella sp. 2205SS18-9]MDP5276774.1 ABC-F type ribosomal protection protein [Chengkuizengella sp. 2205SS18-9]